MNLPSLPTDSLYKFMLIAGVVLCLFSVHELRQSSLAYLSEEMAYETQYRIVVAQFEDAQRDQDNLDMRINKLKRHIGIGHIQSNDSIFVIPVPDLNDTVGSKLRQDIDEAYSEYRVVSREYNLRNAEVGAIRNRLQALNQQQFIWNSVMIITSFIGLIASISGGLLWYFRLQRYQDIIHAHEAKK